MTEESGELRKQVDKLSRTVSWLESKIHSLSFSTYAVGIIVFVFCCCMLVVHESQPLHNRDYVLEETCMEYALIKHVEFASEVNERCESITQEENQCKQFYESEYCESGWLVVWGGRTFHVGCKTSPDDIFIWNETRCLKWEAKLIREANK
jgi:hypothetical protein